MKVWIFLHAVFVHISIICSMTLITVQILDWYNPFMDFFGHSVFVLYMLYASTLIAGLIFLAIGKIKKKKNIKEPVHQRRRQERSDVAPAGNER